MTQIDQSCAKEEEEDQKQRIRHVNCEKERSKVKTESNVVRCFLLSSCSVEGRGEISEEFLLVESKVAYQSC